MPLPWISFAFGCSLLYLCSRSVALNVVSYSVSRNIPAAGSALSRRSTYVETLSNNISQGLYYISVTVGTPAQPLQLILGTGSSDVWVIDIESATCVDNPDACFTPFNASFSQSISTVSEGGFDINYVDGTYAKGDYIEDEFSVGSTGESQMILQMGLANNITVDVAKQGGIMGIGYPGQEATNVHYPNFMDQMVNNKLTHTKLYSLWLNDLDSGTGSILFGGIDTEKYYGTLYSMPIHTNSSGDYSAFLVGLTGVSIPAESGRTGALTNATFSITTILEASTTLIYLPGYLVDDIYERFNVTVVDGMAYCDCKYSNSSAVMTFVFESGSSVDVAYPEMINKLYVPDPVPDNFTSFPDVCSMGILDGDNEGGYFLGDFFLRSAYVVYDLTNNRIGIAQAVLNATASNVIEVPAGAASIPQSTGLPLPATTSAAPSSTSSATSTGSTTLPPNTSTPTPQSDHAVAIGVGVAVPLVAIIAAIIGLCCWRRRKQIAKNAAPEMVNTAKPQANGPQSSTAGTGKTRWSSLSELASTREPTPANSPRETKSVFERKPVPENRNELPAYEAHKNEPTRSMSPILHEEGNEARPLSNLTEGPLQDMPARP